jgi:hypothetical protein
MGDRGTQGRMSRFEALAIGHVCDVLDTVDWDRLKDMTGAEQDAYLEGLQADPLNKKAFEVMRQVAERGRK